MAYIDCGVPTASVQEFDESQLIMAINGKKLPAIDVFSKALKFLANKLTTFIRTTLEGGKDVLEQNGILWVITVPAIWSPRARQFMRKAAYKVYLWPNLLVY